MFQSKMINGGFLSWRALRRALAFSLSMLNVCGMAVVIAAAPAVSIENTGTNVLVRYTGILKTAVRSQGPYQPVWGATSPYAGSATNSEQYWRAFLPAVRSISAGLKHTLAVRADGTLWAWGDNWAGNLGIGSTIKGREAVQVGSRTN